VYILWLIDKFTKEYKVREYGFINYIPQLCVTMNIVLYIPWLHITEKYIAPHGLATCPIYSLVNRRIYKHMFID
jgi:hypothetical protein